MKPWETKSDAASTALNDFAPATTESTRTVCERMRSSSSFRSNASRTMAAGFASRATIVAIGAPASRLELALHSMDADHRAVTDR